jgi:hypothetical protein
VFLGGDTDAMRRHSGAMTTGGRQLEELLAALRGAVEAVTWNGQDAEHFRAHAHRDVFDRLTDLAEETHALARDLDGHAEEQDRASDPVGAVQQHVDGDENKFWFWQDGFAPPWGSTADMQDDIPLDEEQFTIDSINQEGKGNCVALSVLASIAHADPEFLADHVRRVGDEQYEVDLYIDGEWKTVEVSGDVDRDGVRGPDGNQNWATLYEQALIQEGVLSESGLYPSNAAAAEVFDAVTGGRQTYSDDDPWSHPKDMISYDSLVERVEEGMPVVLCTINDPGPADGTQIVEGHAYTVESVNPDGSMTLVNPWGADGNYDTEDGSHRITITEEDYRRLFDGHVIGSTPDDWDR